MIVHTPAKRKRMLVGRHKRSGLRVQCGVIILKNVCRRRVSHLQIPSHGAVYSGGKNPIWRPPVQLVLRRVHVLAV